MIIGIILLGWLIGRLLRPGCVPIAAQSIKTPVETDLKKISIARPKMFKLNTFIK